MKYKIIILILLFSFIQSCGNKEKKQSIELQEQNIKATKDSIELANKIKLDSITKIEEKIAIGKINFGINEKEYLKKEKEFLESTNGKLGKYEFSMSSRFDDNGDLTVVWLNGHYIHYDNYDRDMPDIFASLKEILFEKYGFPNFIYLDFFPKWTDFNNGESKNIYYWSFGNKGIFVKVANTLDNYYQLNISFVYSTPEELEKSTKEREQKEKESKENAVKNL